MSKAPEFIRLKRRRDEDSVERLLVDEENESRKLKRGRFIFKLTRTMGQDESSGEDVTPLLKLAAEDHRHFVLEQERKRRRQSNGSDYADKDEEDGNLGDQSNNVHNDELPPEISQMIEEHLKLNNEPYDTKARKRKPSKKHYTGEAAQVLTIPSLDYVYDIYHLEKVPEDEFDIYKQGNDVGFVKILDREIDLIPDEDSDSASKVRSDDEDSNEENYYQNDYPEDEDDDRSILFGSDGEGLAAEEEVSLPVEAQSELFNQLGNSDNILNSLNAQNFINLDDDESHGDEHSENLEYLAESDNDYEDDPNPLAAYRDRIFGELEKMINSE